MATEYEQLLKFVWEQVEKRLERKDDQTASFVRDHGAKVILNDVKLEECYRIFGALGGDGFTKDLFISRVRERKLHKFLIIPLYRRLPQDALEAITLKLVAPTTWPVNGAEERRLDKLPAELSQLEEIFGHGSPSAGMFYKQQATFCAAVIRKGEEVIIEDSNCERLPYIHQTLLGKGSVGHVWETKIAKNHYYDVSEDQYNSNGPKVIARKDYIINAGFHPEEEREILQQIMKSSGHENIVTSLGSMRIKSRQVDGSTFNDTFSLFMPKADCDLRQFMLERYQQAPDSFAKKERLLACAAGLARGLKFLHHEMTTPAPERKKLICYHMDLKPANILVFFPAGDEDRMIWKLSDFGMSSIKIPKRHDQEHLQDSEEKGFSSWFKLRHGSQVVDPSVSETVGPRGQGTYLAPESVTQNAVMGRASDVWSLGCIVSELFAYLHGGKDAVTRYSEERRCQPGGLGDRYFLYAQGLTPPKDHPIVKAWHDNLIERAKLRHVDEVHVVSTVLKGLQEQVLRIDKVARCGAGDVEKMLDDSCEGYRSLMKPPPRVPEDPSRPSGTRALIR
ncbi:hypothetical protein N0V82_007097 [Gnomoniopsis sp. IMI 355080]|nr:hypothetical protein N0V82_007097 [Gnomoniopsis sp. IMI 355080]